MKMKLFEKNVGSADRLVRALFGAVALLATYFGYVHEPVSYGIILIGIILLATAITSSCLIYSLFGFNTYKSECKK